jgi:methylated-DNA-[protein]-cysteine S-methyltransferase
MTQELFSDVFITAAGWVGLLGSPAGLRKVILPRETERQVHELLGSNAIQESDFFADLIRRFKAYFNGRRVEFPDKLDLSGATPFQREVWQATRLIPYGETRSYTWVAGWIGKSKAARAVGQALGRNPLPVIIPCHRVLAGDGGIGGFGGGIEMKRFLLRLEGKTGSQPLVR